MQGNTDPAGKGYRMVKNNFRRACGGRVCLTRGMNLTRRGDKLTGKKSRA